MTSTTGGNTQLQSYNGGVRKSPVKVREGRREEKREEETLTRQRDQGEEDKKLAKRENKRARKDEQGGERAKRRSVHTPDCPFYASLEKDREVD